MRKKYAKVKGLPPNIIFSEASLVDMANQYPITTDELAQIHGVGQGKAKKFGEPFLKYIKQYVEVNDVIRPEEMVVKTVAKQSSNKVYIIQSIDRKLSIEDIASAKGLTVEELITEIETIVESGTKINLNYYLDEIIDEYQEQELSDFFKNSESATFDEARNEFEEDEFVEESRDIRIMYLLIQFIIRYPMGYRVPNTKTDAVNYIIEKMPEIDKDIAINLVDRAYTEVMASTFENEQILKETFMSKVELRGNTIQILDYYKHHRSPFMKIKDDIYKASKLSVKNYEYFGTSPEYSPQDIEYFENSFQMNIEFRKSVKLTCDHKIHYDCLTNNLKHREGVLIEKNEHDDDTQPIFRDYEQEFYRTLRNIPDRDYLLYPNDNFLTHTIPMKCPTCITDKYFTITPCVYKLNNHGVCRDVFISEVKFNPLFPRNDIEIDHITDQFS